MNCSLRCPGAHMDTFMPEHGVPYGHLYFKGLLEMPTRVSRQKELQRPPSGELHPCPASGGGHCERVGHVLCFHCLPVLWPQGGWSLPWQQHSHLLVDTSRERFCQDEGVLLDLFGL